MTRGITKGLPIVIGKPEWSLIYGSPWRRAELSSASDFHHADDTMILIARTTIAHQAKRDRVIGTIRLTWISIGRPRRFVEEHRDRAAIAHHSLWNHLHDLRMAVVGASIPRSTHDRGLIAVRSWPDRGAIVVLLKVKLKQISPPNWSGIEATTSPQGTAPTTPLISPHDRLYCPRIWANFPFKKPCISPYSSTFDRFAKELSKFRGRSLVHRDPLAFRLDCEAIGAGLIANFSLISSNFSLEFRTFARTNPSKFASIYKNWSPILVAIGLVVRFDRLSGGNLSF